VRSNGGEAMADTAWSVVNPSGEIIKESVGAFASMVLAEGDHTIIAKNKDKLYQKDFTVVAGRNADVEVAELRGRCGAPIRQGIRRQKTARPSTPRANTVTPLASKP
jgi:hypothetical protein